PHATGGAAHTRNAHANRNDKTLDHITGRDITEIPYCCTNGALLSPQACCCSAIRFFRSAILVACSGLAERSSSSHGSLARSKSWKRFIFGYHSIFHRSSRTMRRASRYAPNNESRVLAFSP